MQKIAVIIGKYRYYRKNFGPTLPALSALRNFAHVLAKELIARNHTKTNYHTTLHSIMTKNFFTLLFLMLGFVATAMAQTFHVAATPTELSNLKSGYYVIKVKSADGKTDENGNYLYVQDNKPYYDAKGSENSLAGSTIANDNYKYIFYVNNADGVLTFQAYGTEVHFPSISKASYWGNRNPGEQDQFTLNNSYSNFTPIESSSTWYYMKTMGTKNTGSMIGNKNTDVDIYIILNNSQHVGYWDNAANATNNAQFQFYKAMGAANITYNLMWNGESKSKQSFNLVVGDHFPMPTFPKYTTTTSELPSADATITDADDGRVIDVNCTADLPFTLSTAEAPVYYYLTTATDAPTMLYRDGQDIKYRTAEQNTTLNNVLSDLWYVTGNPFDGYKFCSAASHAEAQSTALIQKNGSLFVNGCELGLWGTNVGTSNISSTNTKTWDIEKNDDKSFGIYPHGFSMDYCWRFDGSHIRFNTASDRVTSFTVSAPTITLPLHYSEADDATFATTCLPYAVEIADASQNAKAYAAKMDADNVHLQMNEVSAIPAGQGVILRGEGQDATEITLKVVNAAPAIDNDLLGTTSEISNLTNVLAFGRLNLADGSKGKVGFSRYTGSKLAANRAYLQSTTAQSLSLNFGGQTTGIDVINRTAVADAPIYDLQGRCVMQPVSGQLYIQGGRKFIAR